jgi:hypothetical protein
MLVAGCSKQRPEQSSTPEPTASVEADVKSEIDKAMAELSPEDRALAETQKICPVSDQPLGSMGQPIKVTVNGQHVFVCCEACIDELKANFDKFVDKLESKP